MKTKKTWHSAITGKFVSKIFAKENPETTVEISSFRLKDELLIFQAWVIRTNKDITNPDLVDEFLNRD